MTKLTFEQYRDSKQFEFKDHEWCDSYGVELQEGKEGCQIVEYPDESYIEVLGNNNYMLTISNFGWISHDLDSLAFILYHWWYIDEGSNFTMEEKEAIKEKVRKQKINLEGLTKEENQEFYELL